MHPSEAERQVEVTRKPRTLVSYREGEQQARAEALQCREEKARLEAECAGRMGLLGLLDQGLLREGGIADKNITLSVTSRSGNTLQSTMARSYRSDTGHMEGGQKVVRLAVQMELRNHGSTPWTPAGGGAGGAQGRGVEGAWHVDTGAHCPPGSRNSSGWRWR
ncbi:DUF2381 family protein [Archangium lansingense]|uniref:DUF2381 family protein n=1 Tax=Archangium lansingense TaxID=2995310 RepID=A0ABT4A4H5_9BACT|nr:DUF2381 family protein [Archangium lansinium]MCY1076540.1 DUF2381 family protein [Archangium lansinium]